MIDSIGRTEIRTLRDAAFVVCVNLDPDAIPLADAPTALDDLIAARKLLDGAVTRMAARGADSQQWKRDGKRSSAEWLAAKQGSSRRQAQERLDTSKRLEGLGGVDDALRNGELSEEQANAIADAAHANPAAEQDLLGAAKRNGLGELREEARRRKAQADRDPDARQRRIHAARRLRRWTDGEGAYNLHLKVTAVAGARVDATLQPLIDRIFREARAAGRREPLEAYAADAAVEMAQRAAATGVHPPPPATPTATPPAADEPAPADTGTPPAPGEAPAACGACGQPSSRGGHPVIPRGRETKVIALVDAAALQRGWVEGGETCEIAGVGPVSVTAVRALIPDAYLAYVIRDGKDVKTVAHLGRQATAHQRTALEARGYRCEVPGCDARHHSRSTTSRTGRSRTRPRSTTSRGSAATTTTRRRTKAGG